MSRRSVGPRRHSSKKWILLCIKSSTLEAINLGIVEDPRLVSRAKELPRANKMTMIELLKSDEDVFAWLHEDMKRLDPKFYLDQLHLDKDAKHSKSGDIE